MPAWSLTMVLPRLGRLACAATAMAAWGVTAPLQTSQPSPDASTDDVTLRIIVVNTRDEGADILDRLQRGESFSGLAQRRSLDPSAARGGFIGRARSAAADEGVAAGKHQRT